MNPSDIRLFLRLFFTFKPYGLISQHGKIRQHFLVLTNVFAAFLLDEQNTSSFYLTLSNDRKKTNVLFSNFA